MKKFTIRISITFSILLFLFLSCNKDDGKDHPFNYINLEFYEKFESTGSTLNFHLSTVESFPCNNFSLDVSLIQNNLNTIIRITDIDVPDVCVTTIGPATHLLPIGQTSASQSNRFQVWVNDKQHDFILNTDENSITITPMVPFENNLFFTYDTLKRIPSNTIWGYILYNQNKGNLPEIWVQIYKAFQDAGIQEIQLTDGNYYFFNMKDEILRFDNVSQDALTFYFKFDKSSELLINAYENIVRQIEQPQLQLRLFDTNGERYIL